MAQANLTFDLDDPADEARLRRALQADLVLGMLQDYLREVRTRAESTNGGTADGLHAAADLLVDMADTRGLELEVWP